MKPSYLILTFLLASASFTSLHAETFRISKDKTIEGKLVAEDNQNYYVEGNGGNLVTIPKEGAAEPAQPKTVHTLMEPQKRAMVQGMKERAEKETQEVGKTLRMQQASEEKRKAFAAVQPPKEWIAKMRQMPAFAWYFNMASETAAQSRLRQIQVGVRLFEAMEDRMPSSLDEMIRANALDEIFSSGAVEEYRFGLTQGKEGLSISADPLNSELGLGGFTLDLMSGRIHRQGSKD